MIAIGLDVGGTKIAAGLVDCMTGVLLVRREAPDSTPARGAKRFWLMHLL